MLKQFVEQFVCSLPPMEPQLAAQVFLATASAGHVHRVPLGAKVPQHVMIAGADFELAAFARLTAVQARVVDDDVPKAELEHAGIDVCSVAGQARVVGRRCRHVQPPLQLCHMDGHGRQSRRCGVIQPVKAV